MTLTKCGTSEQSNPISGWKRKKNGVRMKKLLGNAKIFHETKFRCCLRQELSTSVELLKSETRHNKHSPGETSFHPQLFIPRAEKSSGMRMNVSEWIISPEEWNFLSLNVIALENQNFSLRLSFLTLSLSLSHSLLCLSSFLCLSFRVLFRFAFP